MADDRAFEGKVVLVTGGTRGLGLAMAQGFAARGADIIIVGRKPDAAQAAARAIEATGRRAWPIAAHMGQWDAAGRLADEALDKAGRVDILINNAGITPVAPSSSAVTEELFDKIMAVNFKGPFRLSALLGSHMQASGGGAIINVSSLGSIRTEPHYAVYGAAKQAINVLTRAHAVEYGPTVRVNALLPGPFWTDMTAAWREEGDKNCPNAIRRMGRPEEIVSTALYLASPASSFTTGALILVDGYVR